MSIDSVERSLFPEEVPSDLSSDIELVKRAQAGDTDAFCSLAQAYERRIHSLAFHYCRETQDAEDLSQEVWIKAYSALATFRHESSFYTWLRKITINCFLNHRRSAKAFPWQRQVTDPTALEDYAIKGDAGQAATRLEIETQNQLAVKKVMRALGNVTPQQRLAFLLKHQEEMTYEEISRELGCSIGTVKKSVSRTIAKLREELGVNAEPENFVSWAATGILR